MKKFFTKKNMIITGISLFVVLVLLLVIPPVYHAYFSDAVTAGVTFGGTHIGGKEESEISAMLDEMIASPKETAIKVAGKTVSLDLNSAGFSVDKEQTMANVIAMGKNNFFDAFSILWGGREVALAVQPDEEMFITVAATLLEQEGLIEQRFDYTVKGEVCDIVIRPDTQTYNIPDLFREILNDYPNLDPEYTLKKNTEAPIAATEIMQIINIPVTDARIDEVDGRKVVVPHQVGLAVDEAALAEQLESGALEFSVPVTVLKPNVYTDDLSDDAFPNRLATYSTNYKEWEVDRSANVKLAAQKVNGTVLNSGDIFSFNQVVGKRTYENGFRDAKIFLADKVVDGTGGGICQVSSTIYPAALYSDLKIVERRNHNFVVAYAKPGIDATVVYGSIDFKFQNSLQNPIKIKASAINGVMTVEIWGTKENNNTVELTTEQLGSSARGVKYEYNENLESGKTVVTQAGYDGLKVSAYRIVKDESGKVIRTDNLGVSNYVPLVKIIQTSDLGLVETGVPTVIPPEEAAGTNTQEEGGSPNEGETVENPEVTPEVPPVPEITPVPEATQEPASTPILEDASTPIPEDASASTAEPEVAPVAENSADIAA